MVSENTMQAAKGRKQLIVLPNYNIYEPQQCPAWQDKHKDEIIGTHMVVITKASCLLRLNIPLRRKETKHQIFK